MKRTEIAAEVEINDLQANIRSANRRIAQLKRCQLRESCDGCKDFCEKPE